MYMCLIAGFVRPAGASAFLSTQSHLGGGRRLLTKTAVQEALFSEFDPQKETHLRQLEHELRPIVATMPKNSHGNMEPAVTRYALHRYFAQKYGWYIVGLEPAGNSYNSSCPGTVMSGKVPAYIETLFEQRIRGQGLGLREIAVFAATLLDLIHKESFDDLHTILELQGLTASEVMPSNTLDAVVHDYAVLYFHSFDSNSNKTMNLRKMEEELEDEFVIWSEVTMWARDLRHTLLAEHRKRNGFSHPGAWSLVEEFARDLGHRFGSFQNLECQSLKGQLMDMEFKGTGRVRLSEFYSGAEDGSWTFTESVDYLRALGALDESDPKQMSVIIPNFLSSQTNCITPSSMYSVCCLNECEGLMSPLEHAAGGPEGEPARIVDLVSSMASDTVDAPRTLPAVQLKRLEEIAALHGGRVPLHGRLFAQWMHHAYPRECPYPHVTGTTAPVSPDEWMKKSETTEATEEEMQQHTLPRVSAEELSIAMAPEAQAEALPWITVEELIAPRAAQERDTSSGTLRFVGMLALAASLMQLKRSAKGFFPQFQNEKSEKCFV